MTFVHSKNTVITLDSKDLSAFATKSQLTREADAHDTTTFGLDDYRFEGGLKKGDCSVEGIYDNTTVTGPRAAINPIVGSTVVLVRKPEGTGVGKPMDTVTVLVKKYVETSPVADMVSWSVDLQTAGPVVSTTQ